MAEVLLDKKSVSVKLVYYGPALSGKTTNLIRIHDMFNGGRCGEMISFETQGDRTLFFDLLPLCVSSSDGFSLKVKLFTVPGQVAHDVTRKAVLSRADGVVFVADSQRAEAVNNFQSFENLEKNARRVGLDFDQMPLVIQFNKRDLDDIISDREIQERWRPSGLPVILSSAIHGEGVRQTLEHLLMATYRHLDALFGLQTQYNLHARHFMAALPPVGAP